MLRLMMLSVLTIGISGCQHTRPQVQDTACTAFEIIKPSRADTPGTKRQVLQHNTVWKKLCATK